MRRYENVKITKLVPYENNARTHSQEQINKIAKSIKEFGFINPVLIDGDFGIIAGHGRVQGAIELGLKEVPCIFVEDLTEIQKRAYILADNKLALDAGWDDEILKSEILALDKLDFDVSIAGFDINNMEFEQDDIEFEEDFEQWETPPKEPKTRQGYIYKLGKHTLMCGDSTKQEDVYRLTNGLPMDMCLTDPPYNVDYGSKAEAINKYGYSFSDRHIMNDYMPEFQFLEFLDNAFKNMEESLKPGGCFYIWHASITVHEFEEALRLNNLKSRQQLIWIKNALVLGRQDYQWKHEPCLYGWKDGAGHYFTNDRKQTTVFEDKSEIDKLSKEDLQKLIIELMEEKQPSTILREDKPTRSDMHPTMKPIKLCARLIQNSSKRNENVLDLFGGSGSTLIACEHLGRNAYVMELDPQYVDVIVARWEALTGEKAELINGDSI